MSSRIGRLLSVQIFGESHGSSVGVTIDGLPAGLRLDMERLNAFVQRRAARSALATARREADIPRIQSGLWEEITTGQPLTALFENGDTHSSDYSFLPDRPRPGHADYPAIMRSLGNDDLRGSGHHSGRLTLPYVFAGGVAVQLLESQGIRIAAHVYQLGNGEADCIDWVNPDMDALFACHSRAVPTVNAAIGERMQQDILRARQEQDSVGGIVECVAVGVPAGLGSPFFEGAESVMANYLFSIPAVKAVEFGAGQTAAFMRGSAYNDPYAMQDGKVITTRNNAGGLLGGITNGMPIIARAAFRPTPSISQEQPTVSLQTGTDTTLAVRGRHDPCVVVRAVPVVESAVALALAELWLERRATYPLSKRLENL
ncbi:MAG: chorismate synthase [Clostridia bacterium]|nr:chorismate synthase [Clostridia bacterium]